MNKSKSKRLGSRRTKKRGGCGCGNGQSALSAIFKGGDVQVIPLNMDIGGRNDPQTTMSSARFQGGRRRRKRSSKKGGGMFTSLLGAPMSNIGNPIVLNNTIDGASHSVGIISGSSYNDLPYNNMKFNAQPIV
jgi:hypothetical protein